MAYDGDLRDHVPFILEAFDGGWTPLETARALSSRGFRTSCHLDAGPYGNAESYRIAGLVRHVLRAEGRVAKKPKKPKLRQAPAWPAPGVYSPAQLLKHISADCA